MNPTDIPALYYASQRPSRQLLWQRSRNATGLCAICGGEPVLQGPDGKLRSVGMRCWVRRRKLDRKRRGLKAWKPGGRGRPVVFGRDEKGKP